MVLFLVIILLALIVILEKKINLSTVLAALLLVFFVSVQFSVNVFDVGRRLYSDGYDTSLYYNEVSRELVLVTHGSKDGSFTFMDNMTPAEAVGFIILDLKLHEDRYVCSERFAPKHATVICCYPGYHTGGSIMGIKVDLFSKSTAMVMIERNMPNIYGYLVCYDSPVFHIFDVILQVVSSASFEGL